MTSAQLAELFEARVPSAFDAMEATGTWGHPDNPYNRLRRLIRYLDRRDARTRARFTLHTESRGRLYLEADNYRPVPGDLDPAELRRLARLEVGESMTVGGGASTTSVIRRVR